MLDVHIFDSNCTCISNFNPLDVVDRGSKTQLQVGENLNYFIERLKGEGVLVSIILYILVEMMLRVVSGYRDSQLQVDKTDVRGLLIFGRARICTSCCSNEAYIIIYHSQ